MKQTAIFSILSLLLIFIMVFFLVQGGTDQQEERIVFSFETQYLRLEDRAYLAGRATPVGSLASVWSQIVAVHGQQDQVRLRDSSWQRGIVDQFGGPDLLAARTTYEHTWREWQTVQEELRAARKLQSVKRCLWAFGLPGKAPFVHCAGNAYNGPSRFGNHRPAWGPFDK